MTSNNPEYKKALEKTKVIFGPESEGFLTSTGTQASTTKQLNTIIQLIIQLHIRLDAIEEELEAIKTKGYSSGLEEIQKKLAGLKLGASTSGKEAKGTLKILKRF